MTTFTVTGNAPEGISTYQWKMRSIGSVTWIDQVTTPQFTPARIANGITTTGGYEVYCVVQTPFGRTASTPVVQLPWPRLWWRCVQRAQKQLNMFRRRPITR